MPEDQQNGEITGYGIQIEGSNTTRIIQTIGGYFTSDAYTCTSEEVCDLIPSTEYSFSVSAKTVAGSGPAISVSFVTPQEGEAYYSNPNMIKLSKFKLKCANLYGYWISINSRVQKHIMEGYRRSKLQTQGCKSTNLHMECKGQRCKLKGAKVQRS